MKKVEVVDFNGVKYRRYPNSKDSHPRDYYTSHIRDYLKNGSTTLHRDKWKYFKGEIPKGFQIHHIDGNPLNNDINNLECLSLHDHRMRHANELGFSSIKEYCQYLKKKAKRGI